MIVTVDTGGTKTLISSFSLEGKINEQHRFPTPKDVNEYISLLKELLVKNYSDENVTAIVIALPGIIKDDVAVWCRNLNWANFDVKKSLTGILNGAPIFVENDANLAGLFEARALKPTPASALYVTISTGIGTGFISSGTIDASLATSEGGHALVEYDGLVREWESFASGRAIYETYGMYARDIKSTRVWNAVADRISRGFLAVIPITQPDVIIIGGSIGTYFRHYETFLTGFLKERLPDHIPCPKFVQASYPEEAVIYGGYEYGKDKIAGR